MYVEKLGLALQCDGCSVFQGYKKKSLDAGGWGNPRASLGGYFLLVLGVQK